MSSHIIYLDAHNLFGSSMSGKCHLEGLNGSIIACMRKRLTIEKSNDCPAGNRNRQKKVYDRFYRISLKQS
jgi:hypothetical protein